MTPKFRPAPNRGQDTYFVFAGPVLPDSAIGTVTKKVEYYNIAPKGVTVTSWIVRGVEHGQAYDIPMDQKFTTRRDAAAALVRAHLRSKKWDAVAPIPGGHENVWRCRSDYCGAYVRETSEYSPTGQRDAHDDAFHKDEVTL